MTIAANVLNAIGGAPMIDSPTFIPDFPLRLPLTNVTVDIEPLSVTALHNFMLIESTTRFDKSIGAAYEYVLSLISALCEEYGEARIFTGDPGLQVAASTFTQPAQTASMVTNLADCVEALIAVSEQGGGCPVEGAEELWPDVSNISSTSGVLGGGQLYSHWARFASAAAGRAWAAGDNATTGPRGAPLAPVGAVYNFTAHPTVSDFAPGTPARSLALDFAANYTSLLVQLHNVFNGAPSTYFATLTAMHTLTTSAELLLATPDPRASKSGAVAPGTVMGPPWEYVPSASQYAARSGKARPIIQ